jgi:hypothetical protein
MSADSLLRESFQHQKRFVATEKDCSTKWGLDGKGFKCGMCGHRFVVGDGVRWVYANGNTPSFCNFFTCDDCDGPDVLERRTAAGIFAKNLEFDEIVIAATLLRKVEHGPRAGASEMKESLKALEDKWRKSAADSKRHLEKTNIESDPEWATELETNMNDLVMCADELAAIRSMEVE